MIQVSSSSLGGEELVEVQDCLARQWLGMGPKTKEFEASFSQRLNLPNFLLTNNGSNALHLAITCMALPPNSEIILPSFTWISCATAVVLAGHRPVFCDVALDTMNLSLDTVLPLVSPRTSAILAVHYAGKPVDIPSLQTLGLPIIEDVACAVDSKLNGAYCGSFGSASIFSFDAVKNLVMGEGGGVTFKDQSQFDLAYRLRYCGIAKSGFDSTATRSRWWEFEFTQAFPKMIPSDLNSAVGLAQLRKLDRLQARRKEIWQTYQREFSSVGWLIKPLDPSPNEQHSYFTYVVRMPGRDWAARTLLDQGIYTTLRYHPLHLYPQFGPQSPLPNTDRLAREALSLPLHPNLSDSDVSQVIEAVKSIPL